MARPRTKGPMIPIRLSLDHHAVVVERAERSGETPSAYIARVMGNLIAKTSTATKEPDR